MSALRARVDDHRDEVALLLGDWNFVSAQGLRAQSGVEATGKGARVFDSTTVDFAEL